MEVDSEVKSAMDEIGEKPKVKLLRCMEWLQEQNVPKKLSLLNKNDIQFIIETNAHRKKFLLSAADDDATVPAGIDGPVIEPKTVSLLGLRKHRLSMECEWQSCKRCFSDYEMFLKHVKTHSSDLHVIDKEDEVEYVCLWDICGHKTADFNEMVRHINYHGYHARLLAIGLNGRATLKLDRCKKDSRKRNQLPPLKNPHLCMWVGCSETFNSIQDFLDHVKQHVNYADDDKLCSWAGCGMTFTRTSLLRMHVRSHTQEKLIACYHCGQQFTCNRKLSDHSARQNVDPDTGYPCGMCGTVCATEYLMREHARQHVCAYACAMCDMSAPTPAALAHHVRYRHVDSRAHACPHCPYRAVARWDLLIHIRTHKPKKRKRDKESEDEEDSDEEVLVKKEKVKKQYACHICPENDVKVFSRGTRLTTHLVKVHGAQWPFGHSRFRYQKSEDGIYRLTTTRFEVLEVSRKIVDGCRGPKESFMKKFDFDVKEVAEATENTPKRFEVTLKKNVRNNKESIQSEPIKNAKKTSENVEVKNEPFKNVKVKHEPIEPTEPAKSEPVEDMRKYAEEPIDTKPTKSEPVEEILKNTFEPIDTEPAQSEPVQEEMKNTAVEIMMCDVDEHGNIISTETITSDVLYT